jgi:hypothetical protein
VAKVSDEMLMAYADGALDPDARAIVEAAINKQPHYREKVEKFRSTRDPIRAAFQEELETSHLGPLINRIRRDEFSRAERVIPISGGGRRRQTYSFRQHLPVAIAASVALLIGATLGWSLHSRPEGMSQRSAGLVRFRDGGLLAQGALNELLEGTRSGTPVVAKTENGDVWRLKASFTFRSAGQSPCRRYEISSEAAGRFAGYACRSGEGLWSVHAHANLAPNASDHKGFTPAAGDGDSALEAAIRADMDGDVYGSKEEDGLIASRWSTTRK